MKLQRTSNKKVTKRDQKQKSNTNGVISLQYKHSFRISLKKHIKNKIQESWISHAWLAMYGLCMANYTLVEHFIANKTTNGRMKKSGQGAAAIDLV